MKKIFKTVLMGAAALVSLQLSAQFGGGGTTPGGGGSGGGFPTTGGGPVIPFDGGMSLVLAASGIGYAAKKIKSIGSPKK